jgi:urease accessory protein
VRAELRAAARVQVEAGPSRQRIRWTQAWPVVLRPTGQGATGSDPAGGDRVHLVHAAGGPLGGDELSLDVDVGPGARLTVCSAGATLVQPGAGPAAGSPARWTVAAHVGAGARLCWAPEPTVVGDGAALEAALRVELATGSAAWVREVVVLGRHGQRGGRYVGGLEVVVDGVPLLVHTTVLDGADPGLCGPAGTAGARAVGTLVCAGADPALGSAALGVVAGYAATAGEAPGVRWAWSALDGPGAVLMAVGAPAAVTAVLDAAVVEAAVGPAVGRTSVVGAVPA